MPDSVVSFSDKIGELDNGQSHCYLVFPEKDSIEHDECKKTFTVTAELGPSVVFNYCLIISLVC